MSILKVARLGHPILRERAEPLSSFDLQERDVQGLIDDMVETMREYHGVGLAAPQTHNPHRIVVIESQDESEEGEGTLDPPTVLINPRVTPIGDEIAEDWEGCLSLPDLRGRVSRWRAISVEALGRQGEAVDFVAHDYFARVIQHEVDHLDGIVFLDRMKDMSTLSYVEEFSRFWRSDRDENSDPVDVENANPVGSDDPLK